MRLFANKRIRDIFLLIAKGPFSQLALSKELKVSTRTIRNDLTMLNDIVVPYGISLIHDRKVGFYFDVTDRQAFDNLLDRANRQWVDVRSASGRRSALLAFLLRQDEVLALDVLESQWFVSIYTLRNDISLLKKQLAMYELTALSEGNDRWMLHGGEEAIRHCLYDFLLKSKDHVSDFTTVFSASESFTEIKKALSDYLPQTGMKFSDINLRFFIISCAVAFERIRHGRWLLEFEYAERQVEYQIIAENILRRFVSDEGTLLPQSEIDYMAINLSAFCYADNHMPHSGPSYDVDLMIVNHFLGYVSSVWFCEVNYDEQLKRNLLNHVKAMRVRVNNGIAIINPLLEQIKRHYPLMYEMTLTAFNGLDHLFTQQINDDEIGYLVMLIGAVLEDTPYQRDQLSLSAIIVSDLGVSATRIVAQKIVRMYPNIAIGDYVSLQSYNQLPAVEEDLVIALGDITEKNKQVIYLPPFPDHQQLEQIKYCFAKEKTPSIRIQNYFSAENFYIFSRHTHTKASLIEYLSEQLAARGDVGEGYLASVMEREGLASTLLDDKLAIPHPMGLISSKTLVAVAIFPDGFEWDTGKVVKFVFMLAINEEAFIDSMLIYDYLMNILDDDILNKISACYSFEHFMSLSERYFSFSGGNAE